MSNNYQTMESPITITSDKFDTMFLGTDTRILMVSTDGKVFKIIEKDIFKSSKIKDGKINHTFCFLF